MAVLLFFLAIACLPFLDRPFIEYHWKRLWCWEDWGQEEKGTTEDEMAEWHQWLDGREFGWTLGVGDGWGGWRAVIHGVAKSWTWLSNWSDLIWSSLSIHSEYLPEVLAASGSLVVISWVFVERTQDHVKVYNLSLVTWPDLSHPVSKRLSLMK